ncbi:MAG TPA: GTPase Era [Caulobacteraceae bacterium]|nr:GTPase Era [Caulobacteraceae bacterium]
MTTHAGFAAVVGAPNAGKSTLVNALVGAKVSIVTHKVQTTRFPVRGVAVAGEAQIVLVDTPGIFGPRRRLDRAMVRAAWGALEDADAIVHVVDAASEAAVADGQGSAADRRAVEDVERILAGLRGGRRKALLALNKIDKVKRERLLPTAEAVFANGVYEEVFMISALTGDGVDDLRRALATKMPAGPWLYPPDQLADLSERLLAAEVTREKVYLRAHQELPYQAAVQTTAFTERPDGSARIEQTILVEREGQRPILLGKGGRTLKAIGEAARTELAGILGRPVHLFLTVKVKQTWAEDRGLFRDLGLEFDV